MHEIMNRVTNSPFLEALDLKIWNTVDNLVGIISIWKCMLIKLSCHKSVNLYITHNHNQFVTCVI